MSLNSCEQMIFDYVQAHPDERHYWVEKVQKTSREALDDYEAARLLEDPLWRYFEERSAVASPFKEAARTQGVRRTSMRNLEKNPLARPRPEGDGMWLSDERPS
jgi:hypothetical protein